MYRIHRLGSIRPVYNAMQFSYLDEFVARRTTPQVVQASLSRHAAPHSEQTAQPSSWAWTSRSEYPQDGQTLARSSDRRASSGSVPQIRFGNRGPTMGISTITAYSRTTCVMGRDRSMLAGPAKNPAAILPPIASNTNAAITAYHIRPAIMISASCGVRVGLALRRSEMVNAQSGTG